MNNPNYTQGSYPIDNSSKPKISTKEKQLNGLLFVAHSIYITVVPFQVQHYLLAFIMRGVFFFPILVGQNLSFDKRKKRTCVAKLQQIDLEYGLHFI